jgi:hypothetical protein
LRRAVLRPPFAAAAREGARRVVDLRRAVVLRRVPVLFFFRPVVERFLLVEALRLDVVLREREVEVRRRVVRRGRAARTFSTGSSSNRSTSTAGSDTGDSRCCSGSGVLLNG